MQCFTRFFRSLPMFFMALFCFFPVMANDGATIIQTKEGSFTATYKDESGVEHSLNTTMNNLTALHFWATWCIPCLKEMPKIDAAQKKYAARGLKIIPISLDYNAESVKKFYAEHKINALGVWLDTDKVTFQNFKIKSLPSTVFIDSYGKVISKTEGEINWENSKVDEFIRYRTSGVSN